MKRTAVNPVDWAQPFLFNQGEIVEGITRYLHFSGQTALAADPDAEMGIKVTHPGDMRGQIADALAGIDAVLGGAGMDRSNILTLRVFTTDVEEYLKHYEVYAEWIGEAGVMPPQTLLGVASLAVPDLLIEIEATAGA